MIRRGPVIGLVLFLVVAAAMTWLVYATLRRDVAGATTRYAAMFTDVSGLREGDDVRVAGVRVGRVDSIAIDGDLAKVAFQVQSNQSVYGNTVASVSYQNIAGQRYVGLSLGKSGDPGRLPANSVIPVERTEPSFDVGMLLHGFEPLFTVLSPSDIDNLTKGVVQSLQGDTGSVAALVDQTSTLAETFAGRDEILGDVIGNLNNVVGNLAAQNKNLDTVIAQTRRMVAELDSRRANLVSSVGATGHAVRRLSVVADSVYPLFNQMLHREPGFTKHILGIEPQIAFLGDNLPLLVRNFARIFQEGAYISAYACDVNLLGFFPGLNDVVPIIVNAATPGNVARHTPRCRNMANG